MSINTEEIVLSILQYLDEEALKETVHTLECESGLYFNLKHFENMVLKGKWDDAENYLSAFTKIDDHDYSIKIYFEMRKQKYLEALDNNDRSKAVDILNKDLIIFAKVSEELYKDLTQLLTFNNIREYKTLTSYKDANSMRKILMVEIKKIIKQHPLLKKKLKNPMIRSQRLQNLLNESLNWIDHPAPYCHSRPSTSTPPDPDTTLKIFLDPMVSDEVVEIRQPYQCQIMPLPPCSVRKPYRCQIMPLPTCSEANKIVRVTYTNKGDAILALASNGIHLVWKWPQSSSNLEAKATTQVCPQLWQPNNGVKFMSNDVKGGVSCFALTKTDSYLISTSGGMTSLFNMLTFENLEKLICPPPMVTCLALYPQDNSILAAGLDDSIILIYNICTNKVQTKLKGHSKRVTALAFSNALDILVSGDVNAKIVVWKINTWEKLRERNLQIHRQKECETQIQFHPNHFNFLVVHDTHLATYEATQLKCINQWDPKIPMAIQQATFSSDGRYVYASLNDRTLLIIRASTFKMILKIHHSAYDEPRGSLDFNYPIAIAAHPNMPFQFAAGFSDGRVCVFNA